MTVGVAGGSEYDLGRGKTREPERVRRPIPGQWMIDEWRTFRPGLGSEWLGRMAWNENLTEEEAEALIKACNEIKRVIETAFWGAYGRP